MSKRDETMAALVDAIAGQDTPTPLLDAAAVRSAVRALPLGTFADEVAESERASDAQCEALRSAIMIFSHGQTRDPKLVTYRGRRLSDMGVADLEATLMDVGAAHAGLVDSDICRTAIEAARAVAKESKP